MCYKVTNYSKYYKMSWSEKITRYKGEQEAQKQLKVQTEQQRALRGYNEYLQRWETSLASLDNLGVKELLTQIRDEVWQAGEVSCVPPLSLKEYEERHSHKLATYSLRHTIPYYSPGYTRNGVEIYEEFVDDPSIKVHFVELSVGVVIRENKELFFNIWNVTTNWRDELEARGTWKGLIPMSSPLVKEDIEKALVEDCTSRFNTFEHYPSFRNSWESEDPRILNLVLEGEYIPPGFEYLVDFAKQFYAEAEKKRSVASKAEEKSLADSEDFFWERLGASCGRLFKNIRDSLR